MQLGEPLALADQRSQESRFDGSATQAHGSAMYARGWSACFSALLSIVAIATLLCLLNPHEAQAQRVYIEGPLAGAPAVHHLRLYREGRVHLRPFFGFTLQDEYNKALIFGAQAGYYFKDWLGVDVLFGYSAVHLNTDLTNEIGREGQTADVNALSLPSRQNFNKQIGTIDWMAGAQLTFVPLRGKLALFQKLFVDTDFYFFAGAMAVGVDERANAVGAEVCSQLPAFGADESDPCVASQLARSSRVAIAPTFGVGLTAYIRDWVGIFIEWRGLPFAWNTSGTDERGNPRNGAFPDGAIDSKDRIFHFNHMMSFGATFALPTSAKISN